MPRGVAFAISLLIFLSMNGVARGQAQPGLSWQFEHVQQGVPTCTAGMILVGFDHDLNGNPVLAWQEACPDKLRVYWTRKVGGSWSPHEFRSDRRYQGGGFADVGHRLIVLPGDGTPVLVYAAPGGFNETNTYSVNLDAALGGAASVYLENLSVPQQGVTPSYSPAATALAVAGTGGELASAFYFSNDVGSVRINGATITAASVYRPRIAYALTPDGGRHLLWSTETKLFYTRRAPRAAAYQTIELASNLERFGGEVRLVTDATGVLHALVRGYAPDSANDGGTLMYFTSVDSGLT